MKIGLPTAIMLRFDYAFVFGYYSDSRLCKETLETCLFYSFRDKHI